jgi:hypothetical protein
MVQFFAQERSVFTNSQNQLARANTWACLTARNQDLKFLADFPAGKSLRNERTTKYDNNRNYDQVFRLAHRVTNGPLARRKRKTFAMA